MLNHFSHSYQRSIQQQLKNFTGICHDLRDFNSVGLKYITSLWKHPEQIIKFNCLSINFLKEWNTLWQNTYFNININNEKKADTITEKKDKRFVATEWDIYPYFKFLYKSHQLQEKYLKEHFSESNLPENVKHKILFYSKFILDALAPSNFLFSNPEATKIAIDSGGYSLLRGINNFLHDIKKMDITQTDEKAFEVGKNLAITPGNVIYRNELFELIHYTPQKEKIHIVPLLIIPPWINKYYILDLQTHNSFVKFLVENGLDTFIISWKNPQHELSEITFDDYVEKGAIRAIEVVVEYCKLEVVNTLGYCLGGTLLTVTAALLKKKNKPYKIKSVSLLASMVDFSDIGPMGHVITKALIKKIERGELLINHGIMHGRFMEAGFNMIRANDLIWYYVVNNYLEGKKYRPFDVLFWTNDNTNLPAKMFIFYMNEMILGNKISKVNTLKICEELIDVELITEPVCAIAFCEDHISPAKTVFETMKLVKGEKKFILGMSGHVMGVVNPPSKSKYGYYINENNDDDFEKWKKSSKKINDSWWNEWLKHIALKSGEEIDNTRKYNSKKYSNLENAPGTYVLEKCGEL
ncbi:MAG: PHA/PHB synthase family protein [Bacteroidota bacterium]